jgi:hypothetical protein
MYHILSRIKSSGDAVYCLSGAGRIACKVVGLFAAFSCPWLPSPTSTNCEKLSDLDHKHVNHGRGEFARDDDDLCGVHVHTMEGFWPLLRSWLRPHRGISQEQLPVYLGFFAFVHNVCKRGKALLPALIELLVTSDPGIQ